MIVTIHCRAATSALHDRNEASKELKKAALIHPANPFAMTDGSELPGMSISPYGFASGSLLATSSAYARMRSGSRKSPPCSFAMATTAGEPTASPASLPPNVVCPCAPTRCISAWT